MLLFVLIVSLVNFGYLLNSSFNVYNWFATASLILVSSYLLATSNKRLPLNQFIICYVLIAATVAAYYRSSLSIVQLSYYVTHVLILPVSYYIIGSQLYTRFVSSYLKSLYILYAISILIYLAPIIQSYDADFRGGFATGSIFGATISMSILLIFLLIQSSKDKFRPINLNLNSTRLLLIAGLVLLYLSSHRAGLVALGASIFAYYMYSSRQFLFVVLRASGFFIIALLVIFAAVKLDPSIFGRWFKAGFELDASSFNFEIIANNINSAGRFTVWPILIEQYISSIDSIIFGNGYASAHTFIINNHSNISDSIHLPHNEYIRLSFDFGFIYLFAYLLLLKNVLNVKKYKNANKYSIPVFVHILTEMMFSNTLYMSLSYLSQAILFTVFISKISAINSEHKCLENDARN